MSLVDYEVSSSEDDVSAGEEDRKEKKQRPPTRPPPPESGGREEEASPAPSIPRNIQRPESPSRQQQETSALPPPMLEKLPDASLLLNSPTIPPMSGNDHASRVAVARAESALRKRDLNGHASTPRSKLPRGNLTHSKNIPETAGGMLLPPQLKGRSNVVTEDISKLFVKKQPESSAGGSPSNS